MAPIAPSRLGDHADLHSFIQTFPILVPGTLVVKRQASGFQNNLRIIPAGPHHMPIGRNLFFTCRADVHNPELVRDLKWFGPNGEDIPEDDRWGFNQSQLYHSY